jgi:L-threonylcarbamoyladenylate synthase
MVSPTSAEDVEAQLGGQIAAVLNGGKCGVGLESTIISFVGDTPKLLRLGGLSIEAIEQVLNLKLDTNALINNENPEAPGMLSRHYAPHTPLYLDAAELHLNEADYAEMAFIGFQKKHPKIIGSNQIILSERGNYAEAAQNLFAAIRQADALGKKLIIAELLPPENLGLAINDRLKRASVKG